MPPGDDGGGDEVESLAGEFSDDGLAGELLPPGLGLPIPHDEVEVAQVACGAEVVDRAIEGPVEDDGGVAEGAVGDGDGDAGDDVVDDFVPNEEPEGVGASVVVDLEIEDGFGVHEPGFGRCGGLEVGHVEGRDFVAVGAAGGYLAVGDGMDGEVGEPGLDVVVGVDAGRGEAAGETGVPGDGEGAGRARRHVRRGAGAEFSGRRGGPVDGPEVFAIVGEGFRIGGDVEGAEMPSGRGELGDGGAGAVEVAEGVGDPDCSVGVGDCDVGFEPVR